MYPSYNKNVYNGLSYNNRSYGLGAILLNTVYSGTITGLRISSVNGTAFIDGAGATVPTYADGLHQIEIYDSAGRMLKGVLKAAGSAETLSATELVTNGNMELDANWASLGSPTTNARSNEQAHGGTYSRKIVTQSGYNEGIINTMHTSVTGVLYYTSTWVFPVAPLTTHTMIALKGDNSTNLYQTAKTGLTSGDWNNVTKYATESAGGTFACITEADFESAGVKTFYVDDVSRKQVLTPSTSGATIVSTKGGTTYNFGYKNASFTFNAASYQVIVRRLR
jgi:hypothetical protein